MSYIGIDNGTSGSIGIIQDSGLALQLSVPVNKSLNYTKSKQFLNRVDCPNLRRTLSAHWDLGGFCLIERPMVNPGRFKATTSALRALESTLIALEGLNIPIGFIDSKEWQRELLPKGLWRQVKGKTGKMHMKANPEELKLASLEIGRRLFPSVNLDGFKDADGLLIAEYCRRTHKS